VAELLAEMARLRDENAALKEEIARLKGHKGRPKIKPSGTERAAPERTLRPKTKGSKRGTTAKRVVHEERVLAISAPPGSRFKGYEDIVVQEF
jgi:cell division protein FtsB